MQAEYQMRNILLALVVVGSTSGCEPGRNDAEQRATTKNPEVIEDFVVRCEAVFKGRITGSSRTEAGFVSLTVEVDEVETKTYPACPPDGRFQVRLPESHDLVRAPDALPEGTRRFRAVGHTGVVVEITDLSLLAEAGG